MTSYRPRIVEAQVTTRMRTHGAVLITGPKAVGKPRRLAGSQPLKCGLTRIERP